ncbi:DUF3953 domain-containing protein [Bacillus sp. 2205SS5-2]|uniref:DUF3953 domain-containing protein n=1 Tax=Bacillus sp. 2205SS5-2 TaxID=3109031 RepID=UPI0030055CBA
MLDVIVFTVSGYSLLTKHVWLLLYMLFFLGLMMLVMGLEGFQQGRTAYGYLNLFVSMLLFVVLFIP